MDKINLLVEKYLVEDWEERELVKQGYKKVKGMKATLGKYAGQEAGWVYEHPTTKKRKFVFKKSIPDKIKHALRQTFGKGD